MHFFIIPKHCFALLVEREVRNVCQPKEIKNKKSYVWCCKIKHGVFRLFCKHVIPFDACKHACKHAHTPLTHNTIQTHAIFFISPTKHKSCSHTHTHTHTPHFFSSKLNSQNLQNKPQTNSSASSSNTNFISSKSAIVVAPPPTPPPPSPPPVLHN